MRRFFPAALLSSVVLFSSVCSAKQQEWVEVRSPNFIVVSNAGEKQARKVAVQFEQIRTVFRETIVFARDHPSRTVTILAVKDEDSMRDLLPEYWTKGHSHPAGLYVTRMDLSFAAVQIEGQGAGSVPGRSPYEAFYHEYYHALTLPYLPDLPLWLAEGLAEFFGHTGIEEKSVSTGNVDPLLLGVLRGGPLIPLATLFQLDRTTAYYNEANKTTIFYAECWGLIHYLMMADNAAHRPMLVAYLNALDQGKSSAEAANFAFGDLKKLQSNLQAYIRDSNYQRLNVPPVQFNQAELKFRTLSEAEACAYRGGFAVVRGQYQDGTAILNKALQQDPNIGLVHQYLAVDEFFEGQHDKAVESASKAIALDPNNWFARYLRAFLKTSGAGMGSTDPQIEDDLRRAIATRPEFVPPYGLLAIYLAAGNRNLDEALALAQKAVSFEPANPNYQLALAQVLIRQNKVDEADLASQRASAWARDENERSNAQNFRLFLATFRKLQSETASGGAMAPLIFPAQGAQTDSPADGSSTPKLPRPGDGASSGNPLSSVLRVQSSLNIVSSPMGVDFNPYFKSLMEAIRSNLMSSVSSLRFSGSKDITLELVILKDGNISEMKVISSSGDDALDQSTQNGITLSKSLPSLPPAFHGQSLKIRVHFSYLQEQN